jgi:drug/metabolite transporter (DMT)-like permease
MGLIWRALPCRRDALPSVPRLTILVALALCGFAANSLLCRQALLVSAIDPASFTAWRLLSGALVLWLLTQIRAGTKAPLAGDWRGAGSLFVYAIAFSYAYVELHAGLGALLLFGAVQVTMLVGSTLRGERLGWPQWCGAALALGGLAWLRPPSGAGAEAGLAMLSMLLAGVAWGIYSLLGRASRMPLASTAGNFVRAVPLVLIALLLAPHPLASPMHGVLYAVLSGAIASGLGYALWYAALPALRASQAALLQLLVPVIAAAAGVALLSEPLDARMLTGGATILVGIALALGAGSRRKESGR